MTTSTPPQPDTADRLKNSTTSVDVNNFSERQVRLTRRVRKAQFARMAGSRRDNCVVALHLPGNWLTWAI